MESSQVDLHQDAPQPPASVPEVAPEATTPLESTIEVVIDAETAPIDDATEDAAPADAQPTAGDGEEKQTEAEVPQEEDIDIGDVEPDHYYGDGKIPVFKPTMDQFRDFKKFVDKIDKYGMRSGIVKVIPPQEWRDALPSLDEAVKQIKVKNPIVQHINGAQGAYRQTNLEKQRTYNLVHWRQLCEASDHQPPARRGERRTNQPKVDKATPKPRTPNKTPSKSHKKQEPGVKRPRGRPPKHKPQPKVEEKPVLEAPPTPTTPSKMEKESVQATPSVKNEMSDGELSDVPSEIFDKPSDQPKSVSSRRKHNRRAADDIIDESSFADFDYRCPKEFLDEFTPERCEELEKAYWRTLTYNNPLYGADMPGSLFDDSTTSWNVAKLPNILDVLGQNLPGVNTAYLYLGMWKSTFAWHLEDVDLYSINYIHFGAPKHWYSISQEDARRFEQAMKSIWQADSKACSQFLRHKTYLVSPQMLQSQFNIRVNKLVHHEGEFVITYPYGYHSGFNMGYNCAESVNFATEAWLEYGRVAKKCDCQEDSVWVDVWDIERKLRGEVSDYESMYDSEDEQDIDGRIDMLTPPESVEGKTKSSKKRKRDANGEESKIRRVKIRYKPPTPPREPCVLCPNDLWNEELLPTDTGAEAHRICALYTPETYFVPIPGADPKKEMVCNVAAIPKARLELKCHYCRSKRGACFQCSQKKCARAYHATCAAAAGVFVEVADIPVWGDDGVEYKDVGTSFSCRYHRTKRPKIPLGEPFEANQLTRRFANGLKAGETVQMQLLHGEIFAGVVIKNNVGEESVFVDIIPFNGDRVEIAYKYILAPDPAHFQLPRASETAIPINRELPSMRRLKLRTSETDVPEPGDAFNDPTVDIKWAEFELGPKPKNDCQKPALPDFAYWLSVPSSDAIPFYTFNSKSKLPDLRCDFPPTKPTSKAIARVCQIYLPPHLRPKPKASAPAPSATIGIATAELAGQSMPGLATLSTLHQVGPRPIQPEPPAVREAVKKVEEMMNDQFKHYKNMYPDPPKPSPVRVAPIARTSGHWAVPSAHQQRGPSQTSPSNPQSRPIQQYPPPPISYPSARPIMMQARAGPAFASTSVFPSYDRLAQMPAEQQELVREQMRRRQYEQQVQATPGYASAPPQILPRVTSTTYPSPPNRSLGTYPSPPDSSSSKLETKTEQQHNQAFGYAPSVMGLTANSHGRSHSTSGHSSNH